MAVHLTLEAPLPLRTFGRYWSFAQGSELLRQIARESWWNRGCCLSGNSVINFRRLQGGLAGFGIYRTLEGGIAPPPHVEPRESVARVLARAVAFLPPPIDPPASTSAPPRSDRHDEVWGAMKEWSGFLTAAGVFGSSVSFSGATSGVSVDFNRSLGRLGSGDVFV